MARAYQNPDMSDLPEEPQPGEWQALRGELVALLDQVEGRYADVEREEPAFSGIARRVRNLRDQVVGPEPSVRRREALQTVKRAVDRFSERDEHDDERDALSNAIAEIRGRQMSAPAAALGRRASDQPEFRELTTLVTGLSGRLERLEGELKHQRANNGSINEVANQVEQLTHVVELLAGAVGETGQVKRLEAQIGALAAMIENGPKVDLSALNKRLDDVSTTVGKLAELQAQQMEREIHREEKKAAAPDTLAPAMHAIEESVRNVYDRIDAIERNTALSSTDFERLTAEMAAFTRVMKDGEAAPGKLVAKVDALASRIGGFESASGEVTGLKEDIASLRDAVLSGMEPRFLRIEDQIEALATRIPGDNGKVEDQLKLLMERMDETGAQLNDLATLYTNTQTDPAGMEAMATLVAERTSDALTRKAPAPVAMFGPESLKSIEDRISGLIKSAGKAPDYEVLADMVAERTSDALAKTASPAAPAGVSEESMGEFEKRMTALLNTAGKDTAERLTRLEAVLAKSADNAASSKPAPAPVVQTPAPAPLVAEPAPLAPTPPPAPPSSFAEEETEDQRDRFDAMLAALSGPRSSTKSDIMPANPSDDAPLIDPGFKDNGPVRSALEAKTGIRAPASVSEPIAAPTAKTYDPTSAQLPPRPQSSFADIDADPFATPAPAAAPAVEAPVSASSTSTFVAAARRAQRAKQEATTSSTSSNSVIARALSRFKSDQPAPAPAGNVTDPVEPPAKAEKPAKPVKPVKQKKEKPAKVEPVAVAPAFGPDGEIEEAVPQQSFLTRHRRPLLLAAVLVAVSMLALNLVIQRMGPSAPEVAPAAPAVEAPPATAPATDDVSLVRPDPRVIDMIDATPTGSINPNQKMSFSKDVAATSMPRTLVANTPAAAAKPVIVPEDVTGSIPENVASAPQTFDLPPEGVGPLELRQAAADGDARAQFEIGAIYTEGRAVTQDYAEAAKWYERSAAQGFVPAQYRLGNLYEAGQGVEKDIDVARLWYQRGAEAGNRMAMHNLAALYAGGLLGEQQFESAAEWFEQAAAKGMTDSQFNLGMLYARGLGVDQDFEQSYKWFSLAALSGDKDAAQARDDMAKSLSAEAVSTITGEVATWKPEALDLASNFAPLGTWSKTFDPGQVITTRDVVSKVQLALNKLGFDVGTPDGLAGPKTADAIKAFERGTGMTESGAINPRLLAVLGSQPV
ncbi:MAG: peptidoglycan-binding protein [Candidatus Devosia phytovorans]|uniref:Peptidoglycan-binding protein n=1 Tax=Candidatus Devosia phytovorans TaxID=3121372 RepID=A0AAJ6AZP8_9HYPH|nr:peptidoglycan-binding protein [Devosia sp.]WEK03324.1 MAG: peptidoglycan-binding protein [Devosia sp.]